MVRGLAVPLVCAALAGAPVAARAADSAAPPFGSSASGSSSSGSSGAAGTDGGSWLLRPVWAIGGAVKSIGSGAASVWGAVAGLATPFRPSEALPDQIGDDDRRFFAVLNSVGLQLGEIKVEGTLISYSNYRFVATRQPSVADLERAERKFAEYRANSGGPRGWAKQRIARSILDLAGDRDFVLSATVITLSPWPNADYEITALNRPPEAAERRVADTLRPVQ